MTEHCGCDECRRLDARASLEIGQQMTGFRKTLTQEAQERIDWLTASYTTWPNQLADGRRA